MNLFSCFQMHWLLMHAAHHAASGSLVDLSMPRTCPALPWKAPHNGVELCLEAHVQQAVCFIQHKHLHCSSVQHGRGENYLHAKRGQAVQQPGTQPERTAPTRPQVHRRASLHDVIQAARRAHKDMAAALSEGSHICCGVAAYGARNGGRG